MPSENIREMNCDIRSCRKTDERRRATRETSGFSRENSTSADQNRRVHSINGDVFKSWAEGTPEKARYGSRRDSQFTDPWAASASIATYLKCRFHQTHFTNSPSETSNYIHDDVLYLGSERRHLLRAARFSLSTLHFRNCNFLSKLWYRCNLQRFPFHLHRGLFSSRPTKAPVLQSLLLPRRVRLGLQALLIRRRELPGIEGGIYGLLSFVARALARPRDGFQPFNNYSVNPSLFVARALHGLCNLRVCFTSMEEDHTTVGVTSAAMHKRLSTMQWFFLVWIAVRKGSSWGHRAYIEQTTACSGLADEQRNDYTNSVISGATRDDLLPTPAKICIFKHDPFY